MPAKAAGSIQASDLWALLDPQERQELCPPMGSNFATQEWLEEIPVTDLLQRIVALRRPFIVMMHEFCCLLTRLEAAAPGNIRFVVLNDAASTLTLDFGPQLRAAVAVGLNADRCQTLSADIDIRVNALAARLALLLAALKPQLVARFTETGEMLNSLAEQVPEQEHRYRLLADLHKESALEYNPADAKRLGELSQEFSALRALAIRLAAKRSKGNQQPSWLGSIARLAERIKAAARTALAGQSCGFPVAHRCLGDAHLLSCASALRALKEALLAASDFEQATQSLVDFFSLELWRQRWRIYELWLLSRIAQDLIGLGATVSDRTRVRNGVWELKYARDSEPVLSFALAGTSIALFYQLFEVGTESNDMPDIALRLGDRGDFLLLLDPKQGLSYSRADMKAVCERYAHHFRADLTAVVNYFSRAPDCEEVTGTHRCLVLHSLRPGGETEAAFDVAVQQAVRARWQGLPERASLIVLLDVSGSTAGARESLQARLRTALARLSAAPSSDSRIVLFTDSVVGELQIAEAATAGKELWRTGGGTNIAEALRLGIERAAALPLPRYLWLFTDGQGFSGLDATVLPSLTSFAIELSVFDSGGQPELAQLCAAVGGHYEWVNGTAREGSH